MERGLFDSSLLHHGRCGAPPIRVLPPLPEARVELRDFCRAVGWVGEAATMAPQAARPMWDGPVVGTLDGSTPVADHNGQVVFVDGIQAGRVATWRPAADGGPARPVLLMWAGAAAVAAPREVLDVRERIWLAPSYLDAEWAASVAHGVPVEPTRFRYAPEIRRDAIGVLREVRADLERQVAADLPRADPSTLVVLDGGLLGHEPRASTAGVIKTHRTRYAADETPLAQLEPGWRTGGFALPGRSQDEADRYSCYVRLRPPAGDDWAHGLVRLEAWAPADLERAVSAALAHRQPSGTGDPRWHVHLDGVRSCEDVLRHRRPAAFAS